MNTVLQMMFDGFLSPVVGQLLFVGFLICFWGLVILLPICLVAEAVGRIYRAVRVRTANKDTK